MDLERWTDIETLDCPSVGFRVAAALAMTGFRNPNFGTDYTDVYGSLNHCTGATKCDFRLPATSGDLVLSKCPVAELLIMRVGEGGYRRHLAVG